MSSALHEASNFHAWSNSWVTPHLTGRILDIGSGTGNHLSGLQKHELVSLDLSEECVEQLSRRFSCLPNWKFLVGDISNPKIFSQLEPMSFDCVFSSNVFEHIPDDESALRNAVKLLKPGGRVVLVLPAHPELFGDMDKLAGHFRRYNKHAVRELFERAGLEVVRLRYVNFLGAIGWFINNRLFHHRNLSSGSINFQIRLFDKLLIPILRFIEGDKSLPFGQSLICVGKKQS